MWCHSGHYDCPMIETQKRHQANGSKRWTKTNVLAMNKSIASTLLTKRNNMSMRGVKKSNLKKRRQKKWQRDKENATVEIKHDTHIHIKNYLYRKINKSNCSKIGSVRMWTDFKWTNAYREKKNNQTWIGVLSSFHFSKWMNRIPLLFDIIFLFTILPNLNWFFSSIRYLCTFTKGALIWNFSRLFALIIGTHTHWI